MAAEGITSFVLQQTLMSFNIPESVAEICYNEFRTDRCYNEFRTDRLGHSASPVEFPCEASGGAKSARYIYQISAFRVSASRAGYGFSFFHNEAIYHLLYKVSEPGGYNLQFTKDYKPASHLIGGVRFQPAWRLQPQT